MVQSEETALAQAKAIADAGTVMDILAICQTAK